MSVNYWCDTHLPVEKKQYVKQALLYTDLLMGKNFQIKTKMLSLERAKTSPMEFDSTKCFITCIALKAKVYFFDAMHYTNYV